MKKIILRVLLMFCGLNVFTACYASPPEDWEPIAIPEIQEQTKAAVQSTTGSKLDDTGSIDDITPAPSDEMENVDVPNQQAALTQSI